MLTGVEYKYENLHCAILSSFSHTLLLKNNPYPQHPLLKHPQALSCF